MLHQRSKTLDQWRGWAMVLVLINHGLKHTGWVEGLGRSGVNLFFVISGILTAMSLSSLAKKNKNYFYELPIKRIWRLYPVTLIYLLFTWTFIYLLNINEEKSFSLFYPLYCNYSKLYFGTGHLWSIACEMHFYLLSPFFFFLANRCGKFGRFILLTILVLFISCMGLYILASKNLLGVYNEFFDNKYATHVAVWPMLLGFSFFLFPLNTFKKIACSLRAWQSPLIALWVISTFISMIFGNANITVLVSLLGLPVFFLSYELKNELKGKAGQLLEWIGMRTFSIYLFQQLLTINLPHDNLILRPIGAMAAILVGGLFYHFVEKRFLKPPKALLR